MSRHSFWGSRCVIPRFQRERIPLPKFKSHLHRQKGHSWRDSCYVILKDTHSFKRIHLCTLNRFPQFGPGKLPQHGFARNSFWTLSQAPAFNSASNTTTAELVLRDTSDTYAVWPHHFELKLRLELHPAKLVMELCCTNTDAAPFEFTGALHTYFRVPDIRRISISGKELEKCKFVAYEDMGDGIPPGTVRKQGKDEIVFNGYLDRNYFDAPESMKVVDEDSASVVVEVVKSCGFGDCVVWNPWKEKADAMNDMGLDEWLRFVCIEAAAVGNPVKLDPGKSWVASQTVSGSVLPHPKL